VKRVSTGDITYALEGEDFAVCPALVGLPLPVRCVVAFGVADGPKGRDRAGEDDGAGPEAITAGDALATVAGARSA
jgi:hypothetical protein